MALRRLGRALGELKIDGVITTVPLHQRLVEVPEIRVGAFHTRWLEQWLMTNMKPQDAMMEQSSR
jgi:acetyl-CoA carboxylase biotin carboxylase subunit